jgi:hypothetical protein
VGGERPALTQPRRTARGRLARQVATELGRAYALLDRVLAGIAG